MNEEQAWAAWSSAVGTHPPFGYALRYQWPDRWARIHALPDPGRVASTPEEKETASHRHLLASSWALGAGEPCLVFLTTWGVRPFGGVWTPARIPDAMRDADLDEDLEGSSTSFCVMPWRAKEAREIIARVSQDDEPGSFAVLSLTTGNVYCPYDGGADFIMTSATSVLDLRQTFAYWVWPPNKY